MSNLLKNSSVPLYQQMTDDIKNQISVGKLKENDKLLTEVELSKKYGVSRITVRKAIEILVEEGLLIKQQGIGTFVAGNSLQKTSDQFMGFTESCEKEGKVASAELISASLIMPTVYDVKNLQVDENENVICIVRLRKVDDSPVMIEENHFPRRYAYLLGMDLTGSLYQILRERGVMPVSARKTIDICYATEQEGELLGIDPNTALLYHRDIVTDADGVPIHTCKYLVNPKRFKLTVICGA